MDLTLLHALHAGHHRRQAKLLRLLVVLNCLANARHTHVGGHETVRLSAAIWRAGRATQEFGRTVSRKLEAVDGETVSMHVIL